MIPQTSTQSLRQHFQFQHLRKYNSIEAVVGRVPKETEFCQLPIVQFAFGS